MRLSMLFSVCLVAAFSVVSHAQALRPVEFYFEADVLTVRPFVAAGDAPSIERLTRIVERKPESIVERGQLAQLAMQSGQGQVGADLYRGALNRIDEANANWRRLMWNYAWDLHRAGDTAGALAQWQRLVTARSGSTASWVPPTLAMSLWSNGRREDALHWYAAAVRTEPSQWRGTERHAQMLPGWRAEDLAVLADVHAAWVANPPRWP